MEEQEPRDPWPMHERLLGCAARALLAAIGFFIPIALLNRPGDWPVQGAIILVATSGLLLPERRDGTLFWTILRLAGGGAVAGLVTPLAVVWIERLGNPHEAYRALGRMLTREGGLEAVPILGTMSGFAAVTLGLPILIRSRTTGLLQLFAGLVVIPTVPAFVLVVSGEGGVAVALVASFALAGAGIVAGDRLGERFDPHCPGPPPGRTVWPAWVGWVPFVTLTLCVAIPNLFVGHRHGGESAAIGALKTITTSQSIFREGDKDGNDALDYAGSLAELSETQLIDAVLGGGVKQGYTFRLMRSGTTPEFLWAAAADPVKKGETGDRHFWVNHAGVIYYTTAAPIPFSDDCRPPGNVLPVGK